jgi:aryl-alcohol dehydrogenase-like predicted oxidoreductase
MEYRTLGTTGISTSVISLGTVKFGRNQQVKYPSAFSLPDDKDVMNLLALAAELGINTLDTAPAYGSSEERLGKLLKERQRWILISKAGEEFYNDQSYFDFTPKAITASVKRSLKRLHTDYLDVVLIHSNGEDNKIIEQDQALETLNQLKQAGYIRAIGISTKTPTGGLLALEYADVVMATYNPKVLDDLPVIKAAHHLGKGILIKKALLSGHINNSIDENNTQQKVTHHLQFILQQPAVSSIVIGTINPLHLQQNVLALK